MVSQRILHVNRVQLNSLPFSGTLPYLLNTLQGIFMALNAGKASGTNTNYYFFSPGETYHQLQIVLFIGEHSLQRNNMEIFKILMNNY